MLTIEKSPENVLAVKLADTLDSDDIKRLEKAYSDKMKANEKIGFVIDMTDWSDMTAEAIAEDMKFELGLIGKLNAFPKMALVSDKQFVKAVVGWLDPVLPMVEVKQFRAGEQDKAVKFAADF